MNSTVSLLVEVPEVLHDSLKHYLEIRPDWDQDRVFAAALSLYSCSKTVALIRLPKSKIIVKLRAFTWMLCLSARSGRTINESAFSSQKSEVRSQGQRFSNNERTDSFSLRTTDISFVMPFIQSEQYGLSNFSDEASGVQPLPLCLLPPL